MNESVSYPAGYVNLQEAAKFFGVCVRTISTWRKMGCPHLKTGGRVLFKLEEAERWARATFGGAKTAAASTSV